MRGRRLSYCEGCEHHRWSHQTTRSAAAATAGLLGALIVAIKHPGAEKDEDQRPEAPESELEKVHGVQQEQKAESDENDGADRHFAGVELLAHAEGLAQTHGIGHGLAFLQSAGGADGIDDLVDVEKGDTEAEDPVPVSGVIGGEDEHYEDQEVGQAFGVLRAIDGADAEGKESGKDACYCGIGAGA